MSLLDVQRSLVGFARGSTAEYQRCQDLTHIEQEWLQQLLDSPGLQVTQQIQQWWRISRVCSTAPLTIELLKRNGLEELVIEYITNEPVRTLFFAAELEQFKQFLLRNTLVDTTTKALIEFETGIKTATQLATNATSSRAGAQPLMLVFNCNPPQLFAALLTGTELPPVESNTYQVEINPALDSLWRCYHPHDQSFLAGAGTSIGTPANRQGWHKKLE